MPRAYIKIGCHHQHPPITEVRGHYGSSWVTKDHLRVTTGHLRVTIGHLRVTVGHLRVTIGHPEVTSLL